MLGLTTTKTTQAIPHVRHFIPSDRHRLETIEKQSFPDPWTTVDFQNVYHHGCQMLVVELCGTVVGFAVMERRAKSSRIINLAVAPEVSRQGIGRLLVDYMKQMRWRGPLWAFVRERNLRAQCFFRAMGFMAKEVRHAFYRDATGADEDAYLFVWRLGRGRPDGDSFLER